MYWYNVCINQCKLVDAVMLPSYTTKGNSMNCSESKYNIEHNCTCAVALWRIRTAAFF